MEPNAIICSLAAGAQADAVLVLSALLNIAATQALLDRVVASSEGYLFFQDGMLHALPKGWRNQGGHATFNAFAFAAQGAGRGKGRGRKGRGRG